MGGVSAQESYTHSVCAVDDKTGIQGIQNFAAQRFPVEGDVNVLFIFVQHKDSTFEDCKQVLGFDSDGIPELTDVDINYASHCENRGISGYTNCVEGYPNWPIRIDDNTVSGYQSWTDDPVTEWPANLPDGPDPGHTRILPCWAHSIIDSPHTSQITEGSLTDLYNRVSNGKLNLRGHVWPYTYIPEQNTQYYADTSGHFGFYNGMSMLNHEVISYVNSDDYVNNIDYGLYFTDDSIWDNYVNGYGNTVGQSDDKFDMIVMIYRGSRFTQLTSYSGDFSSYTSLGCGGNINANCYSHSPLYLGDFEVIDNPRSGSGVIVSAYNIQSALRMTAHELGHRHFGSGHTDGFDNFSIMNGSAHLSFSAPDRIRLGWANIKYIDINDLVATGYDDFTLRDAHEINDNGEYDVLWIQDGEQLQDGDLVIEARKGLAFIEREPDGENADGDLTDFYLPNNGLYIYKGRGSLTNRYYTSMPNGGIPFRRQHFGVSEDDYQGFSSGDIYSPFSIADYTFDSLGLDLQVAITDIDEAGTNAYSFRVWYDYLKEPQIKDLSTFYTFTNKSVGRTNSWDLGGRFRLLGPAEIDDFTLSSSGSWEGLEILSGVRLYNGVIDNIDNVNAIAMSGPSSIQSPRINSTYIKNNQFLGTGIHVYGSATNAFLRDNYIETIDGTTVYMTGGSYTSMHGNDFVVENHPLVSVIDAPPNIFVNSSIGAFWQAAFIFDGQNRIKGGWDALSVTGSTGIIHAGVLNTYHSNHFCDEDVSLKADVGGTIYASYNYWNDSNPTLHQTAGGTINLTNNLGLADCSGILSGTQNSYTAKDNNNVNSKTIGDSHATNRDLSNELNEAIYHRSRGRNQQSFDILVNIIESWEMPYARMAIQELLLLRDDINYSTMNSVILPLTEYANEFQETAISVLSLFHAYNREFDIAIALHEQLDELELREETRFDIQLQRYYLLIDAELYHEAEVLLDMMIPDNRLQQIELKSAYAVVDSRTNTTRARSFSEPARQNSISSEILSSFGNYPNPFNPNTTIHFELLTSGQVTVSVYDILGRQVASLVNGFKETGTHYINFNAVNLASGMYVYRVTFDGAPIQTKTMMLIK